MSSPRGMKILNPAHGFASRTENSQPGLGKSSKSKEESSFHFEGGEGEVQQNLQFTLSSWGGGGVEEKVERLSTFTGKNYN